MVRPARLICLAAVALLCACQPRAEPSAAVALPTPRLRTAVAAGETDTPESLPHAASTLVMEDIPDTLEELGRAQYGRRLIEWVVIDAINVLAPVVPVGWDAGGDAQNTDAVQWDSPEASVGWVLGSALPDETAGNILLYGHNNIHSSVFRDLWRLESGDEVVLKSAEAEWRYQVSQVEILPVLEQEADAIAYAEYLRPSRAPRLTLISCWPPTSNTHRVIVVAYPLRR